MNKLNYYSHSGHCYPELLEKKDGKVIAQFKSTLWKSDYQNINENFLSTLKEPLKDGIKVLLLARITFDAVHGLSLHILDIDPAYTLGDLEREKQESIQRLKSEGIFKQNKLRTLPLLPQRIAIISVEASKGYADFLKVLDSNAWHYKFFHMLFPSLLQGEKAIDSIIAQLKRIEKVKSHFDVVALIRGGGGDVGLSCYNDYELAKAIAVFPLPVITGIGHATNETVVEMISFSNAITPTKIAEFLIQQFHNFSVPVQKGQEKIIDKSRRLLQEEQVKLVSEVKLFRSVTENILNQNKSEIKSGIQTIQQHTLFLFRNQNVLQSQLHIQLSKATKTLLLDHDETLHQHQIKIRDYANTYFKHERKELGNIEKNVRNMSPENVLKRGYSITLFDGKSIKNGQQLKHGDTIKTILLEGQIESTITNIQQD